LIPAALEGLIITLVYINLNRQLNADQKGFQKVDRFTHYCNVSKDGLVQIIPTTKDIIELFIVLRFGQGFAII
jgi:hypothetical protein